MIKVDPKTIQKFSTVTKGALNPFGYILGGDRLFSSLRSSTTLLRNVKSEISIDL